LRGILLPDVSCVAIDGPKTTYWLVIEVCMAIQGNERCARITEIAQYFPTFRSVLEVQVRQLNAPVNYREGQEL
jgi:hypothetical protein